MQEDMHYYGTYAIALVAGIPAKHAETIAYASQYYMLKDLLPRFGIAVY